ncbi:hypothetical protein Hanom_Chr02g00098931 [Helianthus anomalus]
MLIGHIFGKTLNLIACGSHNQAHELHTHSTKIIHRLLSKHTKVDFRSPELGRNLTGFLPEPKIVSNNISRADLTINLTCSTIQYLPDLRQRLAGLHQKYNSPPLWRPFMQLCVRSEGRCRA